MVIAGGFIARARIRLETMAIVEAIIKQRLKVVRVETVDRKRNQVDVVIHSLYKRLHMHTLRLVSYLEKAMLCKSCVGAKQYSHIGAMWEPCGSHVGAI
jgi:hypothetical protein